MGGRWECQVGLVMWGLAGEEGRLGGVGGACMCVCVCVCVCGGGGGG